MHVRKVHDAMEVWNRDVGLHINIMILQFWPWYILVRVLEHQDLRLGVGSVHVATDVLHAKYLLFTLVSLVTVDYYQVLFTLSLVSVEVVMPVQRSSIHGDLFII